MSTNPIFFIGFFLVAFLYAGVGHGGASGYLAWMSIWGISPTDMKKTALFLNCMVSAISAVNFTRKGHFQLKRFIPFALTSIPMAFVGGMTKLPDPVYKQILGVLLLIPALRMFFMQNSRDERLEFNLLAAGLIGGIIGLLSGMLGIGGGILLSPILLFLGWSDAKQTSAISAWFILVNSISGLIGSNHLSISMQPTAFSILIFGVVISGYLGSTWAISLKENKSLMKLLGVGLMIAAFKLIFT